MKKMVLLVVLTVVFLVGLAVMNSGRRQSAFQESDSFSSETTVILDEAHPVITPVSGNKTFIPQIHGPFKTCKTLWIMVKIFFWSPTEPEAEKEKTPSSAPDEERNKPQQEAMNSFTA
jgi:hypothetical protein